MVICCFKGLKRCDEAKIELADIGFSRGIAAFDFFRTYNRTPFHLEDHFKRLQISCETIGLTVPYTFQEVEKLVSFMVKSSAEDIAIKLIVTGGIESQGFLPVNPELFSLCVPLPHVPNEKRRLGVHVAFTRHTRQLPLIKSLNYLSASLGMQEGRKKFGPIDDVLYVNPKGQVLEASTANLFIIKNQTLITPCDEILFGITRKIVIQLGLELGLEVKEQPVSIQDVLEADEAFLTSTTREILPIGRIESLDKPVMSWTFTPKLIKAFENYILQSIQLSV